MPTEDEAAQLAQATKQTLAEGGSYRGDWPHTVHIETVHVAVEHDVLVIRIRFSDLRCPEERLGTAFEVGEMFWADNGGVLDARWAATHALIYFGEATFAGGDPCTWERAENGARWYRDRLA